MTVTYRLHQIISVHITKRNEVPSDIPTTNNSVWSIMRGLRAAALSD